MSSTKKCRKKINKTIDRFSKAKNINISHEVRGIIRAIILSAKSDMPVSWDKSRIASFDERINTIIDDIPIILNNINAQTSGRIGTFEFFLYADRLISNVRMAANGV